MLSEESAAQSAFPGEIKGSTWKELNWVNCLLLRASGEWVCENLLKGPRSQRREWEMKRDERCEVFISCKMLLVNCLSFTLYLWPPRPRIQNKPGRLCTCVRSLHHHFTCKWTPKSFSLLFLAGRFPQKHLPGDVWELGVLEVSVCVKIAG